uniref:Tetratricopeptide repeat protein n=1 Tax=candidate division WOR-3 bacterium TaxID=2052148 RepID=A0A7V1EHQ2_UNCW3
MKCPQCGRENPTTNKFCGECGFNLLSYTTIERIELLKKSIPESLVRKIISTKDTAVKERRNVTVVFADISGFTSISEKLDPEELTLLMNKCFQKLGMMIYRYEGIIDKFIGDCIMAIFGAPVSHEDDPERAILSSLDMQNALEEINKELKQGIKKLEIHIGINTGEVIAGKIGSDLQMDYTVMGDTVNVAQRLKDIATPGTILIGPETYQRTKHAFDFITMEPIKLKGKEEPVIPYEVIGKKWGSEYGLSSFHSNLVGREHELKRLKLAVEKIEEKSRIFFISGEIGVGKSRLLYEFKKFLGISNPDTNVFEGRGISCESLIPYKAFADCLRRNFIPAYLNDSKEIKELVCERLKTILNGEYEETAPYIFKLLNLELGAEEKKKIDYLDAHSLQLQIHLAVSTLFEKICLNTPLCLIMDDIQWLDSGSIQVINFLLPVLKKGKFLFCFSCRTGEQKSIENFLKIISEEYAELLEEINLFNLSSESSIALINNLLGEGIDENLKISIYERTNGNPFFIEEICRQIVETGNLKEGIDLEKMELPGSIEAIVTARCDGLTKEAKYLLKISSIIGRSFPKRLIENIIKEKEILLHLEELETADILASAIREKDVYYTFRHPIFQGVSYRSILKSERTIYHKIIAETIEQEFLKVLEGSNSLLAHHYYECGEYDKASYYALKAGDESARIYANEEAIKQYRLASSIAEDENKKAEALEKLADVLFLKYGGKSDALKFYEQAKGIIKDRLKIAEIDGKIANIFHQTGEIDKSVEIMRTAIKMIEDTDSKVLTQLSYPIANALLEAKSETKQADEFTEFGIKVSERLNDYESIISGMRMKAQVLWRKGDIDKALDILLSNEENLKNLDNPQMQASYYILTAAVFRNAGDLKKAIEYCNRANEISQKIGNQRFLALGFNNLGIYYELSGPIEKGLEYYEKSMIIRSRVGDKRGEAIGYFNLGTLKGRIGELKNAVDFYEKALAIAREINDIRITFNSILGIAGIFLDFDQPEKSKRYLCEAEKISQERKEEWMEADFLYNYAEYYINRKEYKKAKELALKALNLSVTHTNIEFRVRNYALLAQISFEEKDPKAIEYALESLKIAQSASDPGSEIRAMIILGRAQTLIASDTINGIKNIKKAIAIATEMNLLRYHGDGLFALAEVMFLENKTQSAMNYLTQAKKIYSELGYNKKLKEVEDFIKKISA